MASREELQKAGNRVHGEKKEGKKKKKEKKEESLGNEGRFCFSCGIRDHVATECSTKKVGPKYLECCPRGTVGRHFIWTTNNFLFIETEYVPTEMKNLFERI